MTTNESNATTRPVELGDFFAESWGYDQTNVDFYQVVRISKTGKTVYLRHVETTCVKGGDGGPADYVAPIPDAFGGGFGRRDGELKRLVRYYNGEAVVNMTSYSNGYLWNCTPHYQTGFGWGH